MFPDFSAPQCVRFLLVADASPGLLPRLLAPFARRDLTPDHIAARRCGELMRVELGMEAMPGEELHMVEGNLRQVVGVRSVTRHVALAEAA